MKKTIFWLVIIGILLFTSLGYCANYNVQSNIPQNNQGYIFISTGQKQGGTEIGTWTDPTTIPTLKGDKGDQGIQGIAGIGIDGKDGYTPVKNIDYFDGVNGADGLNGKDVDSTTVTNLQNEDITLQDNINIEQFDRIQMGSNLQDNINIVDTDSQNRNISLQNNLNNETIIRSNKDTQLQNNINTVNSRVDEVSNRVSKLERTQFVLETSFRILDTKRITLRPFFRENLTRNKLDIVGLKVDIKLGQSYEEKLIKKVNARLDLLEKVIGNAPVIEKVIDNKGNVKSISITGNGLKVEGKF